MRLVKEEHQLGLLGIAHLGETFEEFREHPEEEGRIKLRRTEQLVGGKDVDDSVPPVVGLNQIVEIQSRFAEKLVSALLL